MRFYLDGMPDVTVTEMLERRGLKEVSEVLRIAGEIQGSATSSDGVEHYKTFVELGVGATPEVSQEQIDAFMARADVQAKLNDMLRLKWEVEAMMAQALNLDWILTRDQMTIEHVQLLNKGKPG